jgi:hypothetical protein
MQMIDCRHRIKFVQAWNDIAIFNVCQAADVQYELWTASSRGDLVAGSLDIPVGES